jgi:hypothetical protein
MKSTVRSRRIERLKNALILVLLAGAVYFAFRTGSFNIAASRKTAASFEHREFAPALFPTVIEVTGSSGRYGAMYDAAALDELWQAVAPSLGEALGTADAAVEVTESEFIRAVNSVGVFLDYRYPVSADVVIRWLGVSSSRPHSELIRAIRLTADDPSTSNAAFNPLALYYIDGDGRYFRCETSAHADVLIQRLASYMPNGAHYAFETDFANRFDPLTLIPDAAPNAVTLVASNPLNDTITEREILDAFGMNPYGPGSYRDGDVRVFVEESLQLRFSDSGRIDFYAGAAMESTDDLDLAVAVESAFKLVSSILPSDSVMLTSVGMEDNGCVLTFSYFYNGIEIIATDAAAEVVVDSDGVVEAHVNLRSFQPIDETVLLLPPRQAAAASTSSGELRVVYYYYGSGYVNPFWTVS